MLTGYRTCHDFGLPGELNDAMHEYRDTGQIAPGETARAVLWLLAPERQHRRLFTGMLFTVQEGARVVGNGRITSVLNGQLRREHPIRLELDGLRITTLEQFYDEVSRALIPNVFWGRNLDAFNDILRGGFGTPDEGFDLVWQNHAAAREHLGHRETARQLELRLTRCHPLNRKHVAEDLARARTGEGPTVFDWLIEIIREHGAGGQEATDAVRLVLE
jgi:RNAse (barnase) inhibitor barstar